ncbi:hypothetical protein [Paenibacillus sp. OV219]|uniref:hypothetical protein n=1 Tax=Paenibacillus sp. OV219 TaxID=1884377 RepID=UPI0008ABB9E8|nr:hypothetical protein [Paenibacillus sp. OV219]SEM91742.1 hypothetical protein SAMN05518847_1011140 [Paenibacillus sp. OV219]
MSKWIATLLTALTLAFTTALWGHDEVIAELDYFYSFERQLTVGSLLMLTVTVLIILPLSLFADACAARFIPFPGIERQLAALVGYFIIPSALAFFVLLISTSSMQVAASIALLFGISGLLLWIYQTLLSWLTTRSR